MKSAHVISPDPEIFDKLQVCLIILGAVGADGAVQFTDERGRIFTAFREEGDATTAWEWKDGPFINRTGQPLPSFADCFAVYIECRWEDLFADVMRQITSVISAPTWVLDSDGVVWPASAVDPTRVRL